MSRLLIGLFIGLALVLVDPVLRMDLWCLAALLGGFLLGVWPALVVCVVLAVVFAGVYKAFGWYSRKVGL